MSASNGSNELLTAIEQLTNLVAIAMTRDLRQVEAISLLGRSSLSNAQIATILGTSHDTVRAERNRLKRGAAAKPSAKAAVKRMSSNAETRS